MSQTRSRQEIMASILRVLEEPRLRTPMECSARITQGQSKYYLEAMLAAGLVRNTDDNRWVRTGKGKQFLQICEEIEMILQGRVLVPLAAY